jgi:hypothetical protein
MRFCSVLKVAFVAMAAAGFAAFSLPAAIATAQPAESAAPWTAQYPSSQLPKVGKGTFKVEIAGGVPVFEQNKLQELTIVVTRAGGRPVTDAKIAISGKARDVVRQMPTAPRVTKNLGGGRYRIEGLRFNMAGDWLLVFGIEAGANKDRSLLEVEAR